MDSTCETLGVNERYLQNVGWETSSEETMWQI